MIYNVALALVIFVLSLNVSAEMIMRPPHSRTNAFSITHVLIYMKVLSSLVTASCRLRKLRNEQDFKGWNDKWRERQALQL